MDIACRREGNGFIVEITALMHPDKVVSFVAFGKRSRCHRMSSAIMFQSIHYVRLLLIIVFFFHVFGVNFLKTKKATRRFHLELPGFTGAC